MPAECGQCGTAIVEAAIKWYMRQASELPLMTAEVYGVVLGMPMQVVLHVASSGHSVGQMSIASLQNESHSEPPVGMH